MGILLSGFHIFFSFKELRARDEVIGELELRLTEESSTNSMSTSTLTTVEGQNWTSENELLLQQQLETLRCERNTVARIP